MEKAKMLDQRVQNLEKRRDRRYRYYIKIKEEMLK